MRISRHIDKSLSKRLETGLRVHGYDKRKDDGEWDITAIMAFTLIRPIGWC